MAKLQPLSSEEISKHVKAAGPEVVAAFFIHKNHLIAQLDKAQAESQESIAGFLFAHAEMANIIRQRFHPQK